jgi:hypothetical protein
MSLTLSPTVGAFFSLIIRNSVDYSYWGSFPVTDQGAPAELPVWIQVDWTEFVSGMAFALFSVGLWWVFKVHRRAASEATAD